MFLQGCSENKSPIKAVICETHRMGKPRFTKWEKPLIEHGKPTKWNWLVLYPEGLMLGAHTDIGAYTLLVAKHGIEIEDDAQVGSHCSIYSYSTIDERSGKVVLKKNCRIGTHSSIMQYNFPRPFIDCGI